MFALKPYFCISMKTSLSKQLVLIHLLIISFLPATFDECLAQNEGLHVSGVSLNKSYLKKHKIQSMVSFFVEFQNTEAFNGGGSNGISGLREFDTMGNTLYLVSVNPEVRLTPITLDLNNWEIKHIDYNLDNQISSRKTQTIYGSQTEELSYNNDGNIATMCRWTDLKDTQITHFRWLKDSLLDYSFDKKAKVGLVKFDNRGRSILEKGPYGEVNHEYKEINDTLFKKSEYTYYKSKWSPMFKDSTLLVTKKPFNLLISYTKFNSLGKIVKQINTSHDKEGNITSLQKIAMTSDLEATTDESSIGKYDTIQYDFTNFYGDNNLLSKRIISTQTVYDEYEDIESYTEYFFYDNQKLQHKLPKNILELRNNGYDYPIHGTHSADEEHEEPSKDGIEINRINE